MRRRRRRLPTPPLAHHQLPTAITVGPDRAVLSAALALIDHTARRVGGELHGAGVGDGVAVRQTYF